MLAFLGGFALGVVFSVIVGVLLVIDEMERRIRFATGKDNG